MGRKGAATKTAAVKARRKMKNDRKTIHGDDSDDSDEEHEEMEDDSNDDFKEKTGDGLSYLSLYGAIAHKST